MRDPLPRPQRVTAAGVLLVIVGVNATLTGIASILLTFLAAAVRALDPCSMAVAVACWTPLLIGATMVNHGNAILRGEAPNPVTRVNIYVLLSLMTCGGVGVASVGAMIGVPFATTEFAVVAGLALFHLLNVAALTVSGSLLATARPQYDEWRARLPQAEPPAMPESDDEEQE